jgi:glycosyltransferase involved in cell wall biosynthesis
MIIMKLVVMIPAYNEEKTIGQVIKEIPKKIEGIDKIEILVINDGSIDKTAEMAKKNGASRVVTHRKNRGVGSAFYTGLDEALEMGADIILNTDADGQFDPWDIPRLVKPLVEGQFDVVVGSRFLGKNPSMPFVKKIGNRFFTRLTQVMTGLTLTDTQCGFRAFTREVALKTVLFGKFTYTQEFILQASNKGFKITEIPIVAGIRKDGKSRVVKCWYRYGFKAIAIVVRNYTDKSPLMIFGSISLLLFLIALIPFGNALMLYLQYQRFTGLMGSALLAGFLFLSSLIIFTFGILADMFMRQRILQEEILYRQKLARYGEK